MNNDTPRNSKDQGDRGILLCLDEETGEFLWQLAVPKLAAGKVNDWENLGLLSSPAVDGNHVYVVSNRGEVLCLTDEGLGARNAGPFRDETAYSSVVGKPQVARDRRDGDIIWRFDLMDELGVFPHNASCAAPLIVGNLVYVKTSNGTDWTHSNIPSPFSPSLVALNKYTGELAGEDDAGIGPRMFHADWGSPSAGVVNGRTLIFFGGGDGYCYAVESEPSVAPPTHREPGTKILKKVWWADCNPPARRSKNDPRLKYPAAEGPSEIIATPVFRKNRVFVAVGQDPEHGEGVGNLVCLNATGTGDITEHGMIWSFPNINRSISTVSITPDGLLFVADFSGFVYCLDAETGLPYWRYDMKAHMWGSTLVADGKVFIGDEDGDFVILAAAKELKILSRMKVDNVEADGPNLRAPIYSTAVCANGVLYIATSSHLIAVKNTAFGF
jgi:outer membrane protein assembly factor BamB